MKQDTKTKLIEAGKAAMLEKSYHAVGIKEILDTVGVPKGSFYYYFKSKDDFGVQIIDSFSREHAAVIQSHLDNKSISPFERIKASFTSCLTYYPEKGYGNGCLVAKLSHEVIKDSPNMRAAIVNAFEMWQSLYARMIREAQNAKEIDADIDPMELAKFIHNSWEGAVMMIQVNQSYESVENYVHFVFDKLLKH